ncbi:MAG: type II toxin-antitoxin system RatA family toxin [Rhizobiales bacterium]|nr:type II toxin-antitoxin system RatA family toxin [Hyphomicrobiales bacterium]
MKTFSTRRIVRHSAEEMFDLVADVERYPEFVPLCAALRVRRRSGEPETGRTLLVADMTVAFKLLRETFTSEVQLDPGRRTIVARYLDGPFRSLENRWQFRELPPASDEASAPSPLCEVDFFLAYELKSRAFQVLAGAVFDRAFAHFAEAFERRADKIYHPRG